MSDRVGAKQNFFGGVVGRHQQPAIKPFFPKQNTVDKSELSEPFFSPAKGLGLAYQMPKFSPGDGSVPVGAVRAGPMAAFGLQTAAVHQAKSAAATTTSGIARSLNQTPPWLFPYQARPGSAAVEQVNGVPVGSYLRLDDVINHLLSPEGQPFCARLLSATKAAGVDVNRGWQTSMTDVKDKGFFATIGGYFDVMRFQGVIRNRLSPEEQQTLMPAAITSVLARQSDGCGRVGIGDLLKAAGDAGKPLMLELCKTLDNGNRAVLSNRPGAKYRYMLDGISERVVRSSRPLDVDDRMSALWKLVDELTTPGTLSGFRLAERGHMNVSTDGLLRAFLAAGAEPGPMLGKGYSANPDVLHRLAAYGWDVTNASLIDPDLDLDNPRYGMASFIASMVGGSHARNGQQKVLLVDDGFEGNSWLHELKNADRLHSPDIDMQITTVEQTERGRTKQKLFEDETGISMMHPVWNMAGSELKKKFESPAIGEAVTFQIEHDLWEAHPDLKIEPKEACIIGFGAVGSATADRLKARGYKIFVYDIDPEKMRQAKAAGFDVGGFNADALPTDKAALAKAHAAARDAVLAHGHLVVGCAPCECLLRDEYNKLPNHAVLANAGSGYSTLGAGAVAVDEKVGAPITEGMGFAQIAKLDDGNTNIDGDVKLGMKGLVGYRDLPRAGDKLQDPNETVGATGHRSTTFAGLTIQTGDVAARDRNYHRVARDADGSERLVLRNGGVVNLKFDLPPEYAQIIRMMLFASTVLAATHDEATPGWQELPQKIQTRILELMREDLASKGLSLMEPDFMKTPPVGGEDFVAAMKG
jgi:S-adenosylhomocysteine hydrolase